MRSDPEAPECEHCGSSRTTRQISSVARLKTDKDVIDEYGAPGVGGRSEDHYRDPRQIGRWSSSASRSTGWTCPTRPAT